GIGFIIPVPVIQLFVKTFEVTKHPIFAGLPMLGIATQVHSNGKMVADLLALVL
ncbi:hypothetical protein T492DRAFT_888766, partial [Pavlovales sp. CCMP2436]